MIEILNEAELSRAAVTGQLVGTILHDLKSRIRVGTNLLEVDRWAKAMILEVDATSCYIDYEPPFGRGPFGHYICVGVNDAVLHGKPHDYRLADGDLLTLDLAVVKGGVAADAASRHFRLRLDRHAGHAAPARLRCADRPVRAPA